MNRLTAPEAARTVEYRVDLVFTELVTDANRAGVAFTRVDGALAETLARVGAGALGLALHDLTAPERRAVVAIVERVAKRWARAIG